MAASKNQEREAREARERLKRYYARQAVHSHQLSRRRRDNLIAVIGIVVIAALAAVTQIFYFSAGPGKPTAAPSSSSSATPTPTPTPVASANVGNVPATSVAQDRTWTGELTLNSTKLGISLDGKAAPQAVASFVQSTKDGYYTGKTCHRLVVSSGLNIIQCGSADGTGAGDTDYAYGPIENAPADGTYPAGTIAVARSDSAYSNGRQFFIVFDDSTLPTDTGGYTVMGKVTSGLADLKKNIVDGGLTPSASDANDGAPKIATTITAVTIK
ncbi:peptidylprolyl isomerase [soil metagenome]